VITSRSIVVIIISSLPRIHLSLLLLLFLNLSIVYLHYPLDYFLLSLLLSLIRSEQVTITTALIEQLLAFEYRVDQPAHQTLALILRLVVVSRSAAVVGR
jgi:type III secretory pathway component EscS